MLCYCVLDSNLLFISDSTPGNLPLHRAPSAVTLRGPLVKRLSGAPVPGTRHGDFDPARLAHGPQGDSIRLLVFTDQVESVRLLAREDGNAVSYIEYDSFGNVTRNTLPELWFPLGFACGLNDPFTGFVRFGFRDYDPEVGRFTAKDPAHDMRGDGDLYDYCVDGPARRIAPLNKPGRNARS